MRIYNLPGIVLTALYTFLIYVSHNSRRNVLLSNFIGDKSESEKLCNLLIMNKRQILDSSPGLSCSNVCLFHQCLPFRLLIYTTEQVYKGWHTGPEHSPSQMVSGLWPPPSGYSLEKVLLWEVVSKQNIWRLLLVPLPSSAILATPAISPCPWTTFS